MVYCFAWHRKPRECDNIFNPCPCYVLFENINPQFPKQNGITLNGDNRAIGQIAANMTSGSGAMVGAKRTFGVARVVDRQSALSILSSDSRAAAARALVRKDPAHAPTPPEIARQLGISARLLEISCRDALGHSLNTEILDQRLALAQKLLRSTQLPIGEVAARSGFNSATAFRASFQRRFGTSPRSWRATEGSSR